MWFLTYFLHISSPVLTFLSSKPMNLLDPFPYFLTFVTYSTVRLLCCILSNNTRLYSFLWLTGRVLKKYFGKLFFFLGDGLQEKSYGADMQHRLTTEKGRTVRCYTLDVVTGFRYTLNVVTGCCYTLDVVIGCFYTTRQYKSLLSCQKCCLLWLCDILNHDSLDVVAPKLENVGTILHNNCQQ